MTSSSDVGVSGWGALVLRMARSVAMQFLQAQRHVQGRQRGCKLGIVLKIRAEFLEYF